jgi:hypothetical protein
MHRMGDCAIRSTFKILKHYSYFRLFLQVFVFSRLHPLNSLRDLIVLIGLVFQKVNPNLFSDYPE